MLRKWELLSLRLSQAFVSFVKLIVSVTPFKNIIGTISSMALQDITGLFIILIICLEDGNTDDCLEKSHLSMQAYFALKKVNIITSVSVIWLLICLNESPFQEGNKNRKANKSQYLWQNICPLVSLETGDYCLEGKKKNLLSQCQSF